MKKISLHILLFLSVIFLFSGLKAAKAEGGKVLRLFDKADVLSADEEKLIVEKLDYLSEKYQMDIVIRTMKNGNYSDILIDTEDYFVNKGFGFKEIYGGKGAGMILAMDFERRDWALESFGKMEEIAPKSVRDEMADYFLPYLSKGENFKGFETFADLVGETLYTHENGEEVSYEAKADLPEAVHTVNKEDNRVKRLIISAIIALIVALVTVVILTGQLNNVRAVNHATAYEVEGSFVLRDRKDHFLYRTVNKTKKAKSSSSGSSGGSSGGSSTGSSGKF